MIQKEKDLLLKYLCMALPYRMAIKDDYGDIIFLDYNDVHIQNYFEEILDGVIKPYLRPMSSMTEEEISKLFDILHTDKEWKDADCVKINDALGIKFFFPKGKRIEDIAEAFNYLNSIHIDFMGLIPKGLAIEVNDKNNPY